ncbi:MAG TPA: TonB-dependent receptor [Sphingomicrobium sp.]|nr:TonB-dependent receptor [Sphingomicrobium sp.]
MPTTSIVLFAGLFVGSPAFANDPAAEPEAPQSTTPIIVTGTREQATKVKKNSDAVVDVRSQQEIRSLPDVNAAEALQRIPGVSLESDSGEGRFVNIRGLDADLNGTTYDGVRLTASNPSSPQGGARAVAFDAFPSGILGGLEVFKSLTPEMDAEGLGGVVNILPRTISPTQSSLLDASVGYGRETLRDTPRYQGDITGGLGFGQSDQGHKVSIVFSGAYNEDWRNIDDLEADYINDPTVAPPGTSAFLASKIFDDLQPRWYEYHRIREGFGGGLTFDPSDDVSLYVRGIHAGYTEYAFKHRLQLNGLGDDVTSVDNSTGDITVDSAAPRQTFTDSKERIGNDLIEAGGRAILEDGIKLDFRGAYTIGHDDVPRSLGITFKDPKTVSLVYNNSTNPEIPSYHTTDGTDLTDPSIYTDFSGTDDLSHNSDREYSGVVNTAIPVVLGSNSGELKFGLSARKRQRQAGASSADLDDGGAGYSAFVGGGDQIFYQNSFNIGPAGDFSGFEAIPSGPQIVDPTAFEDDHEDIYAGYGQFSGQFGQLSLVGGVRFEATRATYRANVEDDSGVITPNEARRNYSNLFPDLSLKYEVSDNFLIRGAFTSAIARPGFNQITAAKSIDVADLIVSQGNPNLKPTTGRNFDLTAEYYTPAGGLTASIGLFYKAFQNYIIPTVQLDVTNYPDPRLIGQNVEVDSFQNIGSAHAEGIELDLIQQFTFLPAPFDGFGFEGNVTLVKSSGDIRVGERHTLPQTSPFTYNASLFYNKGPVSIKLAAGYVSRNIFSVGDSDSTDVYSQPRFRLDLGASYDINKRLQLFFDAKNLTNTKLEFTQSSSRNFPIQREFYDADYLGGVRIKLGH